ncbi:MAG: V-type ATPase subunit [Anaerosomatales bacterium]|nr:V-type ATPase subunit [Anaerosomatales bacterium]
MRPPLLKAVKDSVRYGYAVGRVRALETRVLRDPTYERLVDAPTFGEQLRILSDTVYGQYLEGAQTADDVERGIERALESVYELVAELGLPESMVRFFRVRHDFANLRARLKADVLGASVERDLSSLGTVPIEVVTGPVRELPEPLRRVAAEALEALAALDADAERRGTEVSTLAKLETVDRVVERAEYAELASLARASKSDFLGEYVALSVDLANVKRVIRAKRRGAALAEVEPSLLDGGRVPRTRLAAAYALPLEELAERLASEHALRGVQAEDLLALDRLDVATDALAVRMMRAGRAVPLGAEPVVAYVLAREAEVRQLRVLLIGKLAGLGTEELRARLRKVYVGRG